MHESIDPVAGPYLEAAHHDHDFAEWMRYATELKLQDAANAQEEQGERPPQCNNREVVVPSL